MSEVGYATNASGQAGAVDRKSPQSVVDFEHADKVLSHLAGRIQELGARLEPVLMSRPTMAETNAQQVPDPQRSPMGNRFEKLRTTAAMALNDVEDLLNRLDV